MQRFSTWLVIGRGKLRPKWYIVSYTLGWQSCTNLAISVVWEVRNTWSAYKQLVGVYIGVITLEFSSKIRDACAL